MPMASLILLIQVTRRVPRGEDRSVATWAVQLAHTKYDIVHPGCLFSPINRCLGVMRQYLLNSSVDTASYPLTVIAGRDELDEIPLRKWREPSTFAVELPRGLQ